MADTTVEKSQEQPDSRSEKSREGVITVVLTADNHLGYTSFSQQPRKREERQQSLRQSFEQATNYAVSHQADLFIQAGDLFDTTTPDERDRSFVAEQLARLKQANVQTFALGGTHDTPTEAQAAQGETAPQISYARLGALHYIPPTLKAEKKLVPEILEIRDLRIALYGLGILAGQEGDPLAQARIVEPEEAADITLLILHAPIEGLTSGANLLDTRAQVSQHTLARQTTFRFILAGYHHNYSRRSIDQTEIIVAGATQHIDFSTPDQKPGFVSLGITTDGIRWCDHIALDDAPLQSLSIQTSELWSSADNRPTELILERLRPLCDDKTMILLRLEGELTRQQYHQLDLNQIRRYGEQQCFALAIDDSGLALQVDQDLLPPEFSERLSPREELIALADEWIANAFDEQEQQTIRTTREELLQALDETKGIR